MKKETRLIRALKGEKGLLPFWFMRQAGRYLPEYREVRSRIKNFLDMCYSPDIAAEVTLQPIRRFGMDAAIIFSDILVIPHALGMEVWFEEGSGPRLTALRDGADIKALSQLSFSKRLAPVYDAIAKVEALLPRETSLIGFAGAPWTLACYMLEGRSSKDFSAARVFTHTNEESFILLLDILVEAVVAHLDAQVKAGADVVQLFDSWAGVLEKEEFRRYSIAPTRQIVNRFKALHPGVPVIGFPRGAGRLVKEYMKETGVDAVSVDAEQPLDWLASEVQPLAAVQGNLDNVLLAENKEGAVERTREIVDVLGEGRFIFNLGHGVLPQTPTENLQAVCDVLLQRRGA